MKIEEYLSTLPSNILSGEEIQIPVYAPFVEVFINVCELSRLRMHDMEIAILFLIATPVPGVVDESYDVKIFPFDSHIDFEFCKFFLQLSTVLI